MDIVSQYKIMIAHLSRRVPLIVRETENGHFNTIRTNYCERHGREVNGHYGSVL